MKKGFILLLCLSFLVACTPDTNQLNPKEMCSLIQHEKSEVFEKLNIEEDSLLLENGYYYLPEKMSYAGYEYEIGFYFDEEDKLGRVGYRHWFESGDHLEDGLKAMEVLVQQMEQDFGDNWNYPASPTLYSGQSDPIKTIDQYGWLRDDWLVDEENSVWVFANINKWDGSKTKVSVTITYDPRMSNPRELMEQNFGE